MHKFAYHHDWLKIESSTFVRCMSHYTELCYTAMPPVLHDYDWSSEWVLQDLILMFAVWVSI